MGSRTQRVGEHFEQVACTYLSRRGLRLVTRNFRCRFGEIDLVMTDGSSLVFVEVRFRASGHYGSALDTVVAKKQRRLVLAAAHFLQCTPRFTHHPCRFDVVAIDESCRKIDWIRAAFS